MGWLIDEWSLLSDELIPAVAQEVGDGGVTAAVCGSARNAAALALALHTASPAEDFNLFLCPPPSYSDPVAFSAAEVARLEPSDVAGALERTGRRWLPTKELLSKVIVDRPDRPVDLVVINRDGAGPCTSDALDQLRSGGHVFVQDGDLAELLDPDQYTLYGPTRRLGRKTSPRTQAVGPVDKEPGPTLAAVADRAELIEAHYPLARSLARRYTQTHVERADLDQVAFAALVRAAGYYDPGRHTAFASYATVSISGELKRYFRDKTWAVRVPRSLQEAHLAVKAARDDLSQKLGTSPSIAQIAEHVGTTEETVISSMEAADNYRLASLDAPGSSEDGDGTQVAVTDDVFEHRLDLRALAEALPDLEPAQRLILQRVFFDDRSQREVAAELGVSQMQVSRQLARTLLRLREAMAATDG